MPATASFLRVANVTASHGRMRTGGPIVTAPLGLMGGRCGGDATASNLLVSNKPLDNRSIARRSHARRRRVAIRITAAVRDVFTLIDSDRDRYLATGAALQLHIALSVGDTHTDSDSDRQLS